MSELAKFNSQVRRFVENFRTEHVATHHAKVFPKIADYPLTRLKTRIAEALSERWGGRLTPQFDPIQRSKFGGDLAVKLPELLSSGGPKGFIQNHLPWITQVLSDREFADAIVRIATRGMYVNVTISDRWLLDGAQRVIDLGRQYGAVDSLTSRVILVDYSSPNVAKVLHAGHIRSTIIGHVLSNLYEQCGALVYRVNHINDFGGFGFTLEGYRRFKSLFPDEMSQGERLLEVYKIRRTVERSIADGAELTELATVDRELLRRYFPQAANIAELRIHFQDFIAASDARFAALEAGCAEEVELWRQMVTWSLAEFDRFYQALKIGFHLILGESFYFQAGDAVVDACLDAGTAVVYTEALADSDISAIDERVARDELTSAEREAAVNGIRKDIGAVVIPLGGAERYVVRRADGLSIYATRDLGAVQVRRELFDPTDIVYVVGQEQRVHFDRLFRAAVRTGLAAPGCPRLQHLYFGFYTDARTGRKLSSRESVANVDTLLASSVAHFRSILSNRGKQSEDERDAAARELSVGSLVFNDLKQDVKGKVEVDVADMQRTIAGFEQSGGAYVVYSACRARSILRKYGKSPPRAAEIPTFELDEQEVALLLTVMEMPERIALAAEQSNPSVLVRYLLDLATIYNSYYARAPVIQGGVANLARLLITDAVQIALINGLKLCHVECPEII